MRVDAPPCASGAEQSQTLCIACPCRGSYTFQRDVFEAGPKAFSASVVADQLSAVATTVPALTVAVEHHPRLTLGISEDRCVLAFAGKASAVVLCVEPYLCQDQVMLHQLQNAIRD